MVKKTILLILFYLLVIDLSNNYCQSVNGTETKDSLVKVKIVEKEKNLTIQDEINNATKIIDDYYAKEQEIKKINNEQRFLKEKKTKYLNQIKIGKVKIKKSLEEIKLIKDSVIINRKNLDLAIKRFKKKDSIKLANDTLLINSKIEDFKASIVYENKKIEKINQQIILKEKSILSVDSKLELLDKKNLSIDGKSISSSYKKFKSVSPFFKDSVGEVNFFYKNQNYIGFITNLKQHKIQFHLNYRNVKDPNAIKYIQLGKVKSVLEKKGNEVLMLTNGGMYTPRNSPEGLLIGDSVELEPIDLEVPSGFLNFYMMPNGVFYIEDNKGFIEESNSFNAKYKSKKINPTNATQSGPMLVNNNEHHPAFNHGSSSRKIRSGVGIMPNGKLVFLISNRSITNFHDFATIFKDIFGCENALFLDGAISKMYLKNNNPKTIGGNFGPIISVINK